MFQTSQGVSGGWAYSHRKLNTNRKVCVSDELFLELIPLDRLVVS
jgi:hypothetical protein